MPHIAKVLPQPETQPKDPFLRSLQQGLHESWQKLAEVVNGGLRPEDNESLSKVTVTSDATPDTEFAVAHTLKRTPVGYRIIRKDKAGDVYDGVTAFDTSNIYLKCAVASVTMTLYIW